MQRIVGLLVFQTPDPQPITQASPWLDMRFPEPVEAMVARIEAQSHRRFLKSHLPFDGQPVYDEIKYIHVATSRAMGATPASPSTITVWLSPRRHWRHWTGPVWRTRRLGVPIHAFPPIQPSISTDG
jgi:hypothetical protein